LLRSSSGYSNTTQNHRDLLSTGKLRLYTCLCHNEGWYCHWWVELDAALIIVWMWLKITIQQFEIVMPSSLFINVSESMMQMWRASLMSSVMIFATLSNTLTLSQSTWWWWFKACPATTHFSGLPLLVAVLRSFILVLKHSLSPLCRQLPQQLWHLVYGVGLLPDWILIFSYLKSTALQV